MPQANQDAELTQAKANLRQQFHTQRSTHSARDRAQWDAQRTALLLHLIAATPECVLACYLSTPGEPDTLDFAEQAWRRGHRVLCPVLSGLPNGQRRHDPAWARYTGPSELRSGLWGIPEPIGEVWDAGCLAEVAIVLVSALAAGRDGSRLGTGGGWFDRALAQAGPDTQRWVLVYPDEVMMALPQGHFDLPMHQIVTPSEVIPTRNNELIRRVD